MAKCVLFLLSIVLFLYKHFNCTKTICMKKLKIFVIFAIFCAILFEFANFSNICANHSQNFAFAFGSKIQTPNQEFEYTYDVHHLFTHCLLAYPSVAFSKSNSMSKHFANDCITPNEFESILQQLYKNNFVLVDINKTFTSQNGDGQKLKVKVPVGKKALILSFDDVVYDQRKMSKGMVDKIILDNGNIATQTFVNGKNEISTSNEFVTILENFVRKYPDFSPFGAKGTICLTGFDGILGYRTSSKNTVNRESEIQNAKQVVKKLKQDGWNFACHSYGHYHMKKISEKKFEQEIKLWQSEVEPIIGKTKVYVYPYGEWEIATDGKISQKHQMLKDAGFCLFCGVGMQKFYSYLPFDKNISPKVLFMDRICVDGYTICNQQKKLAPYFDANLIKDKLRSLI